MARRISCNRRLLRRARRVSLEPESIGAAVDLAGPFEAVPAFADMHLHKDRRIGDGGKHALPHQMIEAIDRCLAVRPRHLHAMGCRFRHGCDDGVVEHLRHEIGQPPPIKLATQSTKRLLVATASVANSAETSDPGPVS